MKRDTNSRQAANPIDMAMGKPLNRSQSPYKGLSDSDLDRENRENMGDAKERMQTQGMKREDVVFNATVKEEGSGIVVALLDSETRKKYEFKARDLMHLDDAIKANAVFRKDLNLPDSGPALDSVARDIKTQVQKELEYLEDTGVKPEPFEVETNRFVQDSGSTLRSRLAGELDRIANSVELQGHIKEAYELDRLSNTLESLGL